MTFPEIPSISFGDLPEPKEEEKETSASIGERYKAYTEVKRREGREAPSLQKWYSDALSKRGILAPSERDMGFAPVAGAMSAMEEEAKNTKTLYPSGFDRHFLEKEFLAERLGPGLDQGMYERKVTELVDPEPWTGGGAAGYSSTVMDSMYEKAKEEATLDWTPETKNDDGVLINWKGDQLPEFAVGWKLDKETPYYGGGWEGAKNKFNQSLFNQGFMVAGKIPENIMSPEQMLGAGAIGIDPATGVGSGLALGKAAFDVTIGFAIEGLGVEAEKWIGKELISTQMLAETGEPILWQKKYDANLMSREKLAEIEAAEDAWEAKHGYEPPTKAIRLKYQDHWLFDFLDRIDPIKYAANKTVVIAKLIRGDLKLSDVKEYQERAKGLSKFAWSLAYQDQDAIREFEYRVTVLGENPDLVALDMENPWSEAIGRALVNPINLIGYPIRWLKGQGQINAALQFYNTPVDEFTVAAAARFGKVGVIKTGTTSKIYNIVDDIGVLAGERGFAAPVTGTAVGGAVEGAWVDNAIVSFNAAHARTLSGLNAHAGEFGLLVANGATKQHLMMQTARLELLSIQNNIKDIDTVADVIVSLANITSSDVEAQKNAILLLNDLLIDPERIKIQPSIDLQLLLGEVLRDSDGLINPTKLVKEIEAAVKAGTTPLDSVLSIVDRATKNIFPTARQIVDAKKALAINPDAKVPAAAKAFIDAGLELPFVTRFASVRSATAENSGQLAGWAGGLYRLQKKISSLVFIDLNFRMVTRGGLYDLTQSGIIGGPGIYLHSAEGHADRAVKILGADHPGFMQGFEQKYDAGLDNAWAEKESGGTYKTMGSFMGAVGRGEITGFGGRGLRYLEQKSSQRIISHYVEKAWRDLIVKCRPSTAELVAAGASQEFANSISQIFINNWGDIEKTKQQILEAISGENAISTKDLMEWIPQEVEDVFTRMGLMNEAERIVVDANTFEEAAEGIDLLFEGQMALTKGLAENFPLPTADPMDIEMSIGHIQDAAFEAAYDPINGKALLDVHTLSVTNGKIQAGTNVIDTIGRAIDFIKQEFSTLLINSELTNEARRGANAEIGEILKEYVEPRTEWREITQQNRDDGFAARDISRTIIKNKFTRAEELELWELIKKDLRISGDAPADKWEMKDKMWSTIFARNTTAFMEARQKAVLLYQELAGKLIGRAFGGDTAIADSVMNSPEVLAVQENELVAIMWDNTVIVDGVGKPVGPIIQGHIGMGDNANASRAIASWMNPKVGVFRVDNAYYDSEIIRATNKALGTSYTDIDQISPEEVFEAYNHFRAENPDLTPIKSSYEEIVGYKPEVRVEEAVPAQNLVSKASILGGHLDLVDAAELRQWALDNGDVVKVTEIIESAGSVQEQNEALVEYAKELINEIKDGVSDAVDVTIKIPPLESIIDDDIIRVYQGRPTPEARGVSWTRDYTRATAHGEVFTKEVTGAEWKQAVSETLKGKGVDTALEAKAGKLGLEEGRFVSEFGDDAQKLIVEGEQLSLIDDIEPVIPPHDGATDISAGRDVYEQRNILYAAMERFKLALKNVWNKKEYVNVTPEAKGAVKRFFAEFKKRMPGIKDAAAQYGQANRDRIIFDYDNRLGGDDMLSMFRNFHFWPTRTAYNWGKRAPFYLDYIQAYIQYREAMEKYHADRPPWLRQYWSTNEIFGLDADNPLYFSLASLLDVYQNVISDFDDPDKRATWFTSVVDQMSKVIPGSMGLIMQYAIAAGLKTIGEDEAAAKWGGRTIPLTQTVKGLTSIIGINEGRGIDLDPSIWMFSSNNSWDDLITGRTLSAGDEKRVGTAMGYLIDQYPDMPEELLDQAKAHEGPLWDEAVAIVAKQGAFGNIVSFFTGINAKVRSKDDLIVSKFWQEYIFLMTQYDTTDAISWRTKRAELMAKYPFAETMLLARKGTEERNISYGYSVLSRIPPGETDNVSKAAGFKYDILSYFYDNKGDVSDLPQEDQDKLWIFFAEAGASIAIPDKATKGEWVDASAAYGEMLVEMEKVFGEKILDKIDAGYNLKGESLNSRDDWYDYLEQFPEVQEASRWKAEYILQHPTLSAYYGSIDRLRSFWMGGMYQALEEEFTAKIWDIQTQYFIYQDTGQTDKASAWKKAHPELQEYWDKRNKVYMPAITEHMAVYGEKLPEGQDIRLRPDFVPEEASTGALDIAEFIEAPDLKTYRMDEWVTMLGPETVEVALFAWEGVDIGEDMEAYLKGKADQFNMEYEEFIISIGQADR